MKSLLPVIALLLLVGCAGHRPGYPEDYRLALAQTERAAATDDAAIERFTDLYQNLKAPALEERIAGVYADDFYFSDTLHVFRNLPSLTTYMEATADRVESIEVDITRILRDGDDVWLIWDMRTHTRVLGRNMRADTIGMTHLRFNSEGRVVLHQDYWDSAEGLFIHIPLIGGLVRWTRNRL
ncbi:MAG: nuclear transport factor 2 family protein [Alcanivoracaceae bacterium]